LRIAFSKDSRDIKEFRHVKYEMLVDHLCVELKREELFLVFFVVRKPEENAQC